MFTLEELKTAFPLAILIIIILWLSVKIYRFLTEPRKVILIYADWCGACQRFKPTWNALKSNPKLAEHMSEVNSDSPAMKDIMDIFEVKSFPTIIAVKGDVVSQYRGDRSYDDLEKFIQW